MSSLLKPESFKAVSQGLNDLLIKCSIRPSNFALFNLILICFGPVLSAVMKGILISVSTVDDNSHFAFSAASLIL